MARARRAYESLRSFLSEGAPFFLAITCTTIGLGLIFVIVSLGRLHEKEKRQDVEQMSQAAMTVEVARQLLVEALDVHNGVSRTEHDRLLADIATLLARPPDQVVVSAPAPGRTTTTAPRRTSPDTTATATPVDDPQPTTTTALPAPVCERGKSCGKGKK